MIRWDKDILQNKIENGESYESIGRYFGCSGNAVKKAAKRFCIKLHPKRVINPSETFNKKYDKSKCVSCGKEVLECELINSLCFDCYNNSKAYRIQDNHIVDSNIIGDMGEQIVIGEFGKFGIRVLKPLSNALPFDLVLYYNKKLYKCQIKSSYYKDGNDVSSFKLFTENKNGGIITRTCYNRLDVDIFALCNGFDVFLLTWDDIGEKERICLRYTSTKSKRIKNVNYAEDYKISKERIKKILL